MILHLARRLYERLSGAEASALRHQRDAYAEAGGEERRARMAAERERDDAEKRLADLRRWAEAGAATARVIGRQERAQAFTAVVRRIDGESG